MKMQRLSYTSSVRFKLHPSFAVLFLLQLSLLLFAPNLAASACTDAAVVGVACESSVDPALVRSFASNNRHVGNPVDVITGAKQQREIDYQATGSALHFSRYYHSGRSDTNNALGQGWRHSYQLRLYNAGDQRLRLQQGDGRWIDFSQTDSESDSAIYIADAVEDGYIVRSGTPVWYLPDGRTLHFHGSFLTRIEYQDGNQLALFYKQRRLESVTDSQGRRLLFEYAAFATALPEYGAVHTGEHPGHLIHVELPSGKRINFLYDRHKNLESVVYPNQESKRYLYGDSTYPHHMTAISDVSVGVPTTRTWTYDSSGKVVRFDDSNADALSLAYLDPADDTGRGETVVDYSGGRRERFQWQIESVNQSAKLIGGSSQDCTDCVGVHWQPDAAQPQDSADVISKHRARSATGKKKQVGNVDTDTGVATELKFPDYHQFEPVPDSFDQLVDVTIDGVTHKLRIKALRTGEVADVSVGNSSLSTLKNKWTEGKIERCDDAPLLRRASINPPPELGCLEDLIYLIELQQHVEEMNTGHGLRGAAPMLRNSSGNRAAACLVNPFQSCAELQRDFELAQLSSCAYAELLQSCGAQWQVVLPASIGLSDTDFNDESFSTTLFFNATTDEYVLSFRGTDNLGDWKDNLLQASGKPSAQYERAVALAKSLREKLPAETISFTGHSLGGGLATAAALSIQAQATVFNAAALHPDTAQKLGLNYADAQALVNVTTVDGDLLTAIQEPDPGKDQLIDRYRAPGEHTMIAAPSDQWVDEQKANSSFFMRRDGIVLHSITAVLETEEAMLIALCGTTPERV